MLEIISTWAKQIDHETMRLVQALGGDDAFARTLVDYVWMNGARQALMRQPPHDSGDAVSGW